MKQLIAFTKKESLEIVRNSKLLIIGIVFIIVGIMNPAIAMLTPKLMELMSEQLEGAGIVLDEVTVNALTSWQQYFKNLPMAVLVFLLMFSGILVGELQKGTLINMLTKGLNRSKVVISKFIILTIVWSLCLSVCFGITYGYNSYFWDNSIAKHLGFTFICTYIGGIWLISLIFVVSMFIKSSTGVASVMAVIFLGKDLIQMIPGISKHLPTFIFECGKLVDGAGKTSDYNRVIIEILILTVVNIIAAIYIFNRKNI